MDGLAAFIGLVHSGNVMNGWTGCFHWIGYEFLKSSNQVESI
jgi:hypothetical protein